MSASTVSTKVDVAVIGAGPAGLAAAAAARRNGAGRVVIIERDAGPGGILPQCVHDGFGLHLYGERLTGPEVAEILVEDALACGVEVWPETTVTWLSPDRRLELIGPTAGVRALEAGAVVLAMGCRERTRSQVRIHGTRPAGVFTAGAAQRCVNVEGLLPGRHALILGSGDVGLIMARRLTLEGAEVVGVFEILPEPSGLRRNTVQCLDDFGIPLHLSHTVTAVHGRKRVEGVTVAQVDAAGKPVAATARFVACDTLILSVGLIPENELSRQAGIALDSRTGGPVVDDGWQTSVPGVFACGNAVHVFDLVDYVVASAKMAGESAARFASTKSGRRTIALVAGDGIRYVIPQLVREASRDLTLYIRVTQSLRRPRLEARVDGRVIASRRRPAVRPPELEVWPLELELADLPGAATPSTPEIEISACRDER